jgi:hypothetical protein
VLGRELEFIRRLSLLTEQQKCRWVQTGSDAFEGRLADQVISAEFIHFARTDEMGADRTMVRLTGFRMVLDYCIGTEGYDLVCTMLAYGDPGWVEHRALFAKRLEQAEAFLQALADNDTVSG